MWMKIRMKPKAKSKAAKPNRSKHAENRIQRSKLLSSFGQTLENASINEETLENASINEETLENVSINEQTLEMPCQ